MNGRLYAANPQKGQAWSKWFIANILLHGFIEFQKLAGCH
jgi:hypothetical protein